MTTFGTGVDIVTTMTEIHGISPTRPRSPRDSPTDLVLVRGSALRKRCSTSDHSTMSLPRIDTAVVRVRSMPLGGRG